MIKKRNSILKSGGGFNNFSDYKGILIVMGFFGFLLSVVMIVAIESNLKNGYFTASWGVISEWMITYLIGIFLIAVLSHLIPQKRYIWIATAMGAVVTSAVSALIWIPFSLLVLENEEIDKIPAFLLLAIILSILIFIVNFLFGWSEKYWQLFTPFIYMATYLIGIVIIVFIVLNLVLKVLDLFDMHFFVSNIIGSIVVNCLLFFAVFLVMVFSTISAQCFYSIFSNMKRGGPSFVQDKKGGRNIEGSCVDRRNTDARQDARNQDTSNQKIRIASTLRTLARLLLYMVTIVLSILFIGFLANINSSVGGVELFLAVIVFLLWIWVCIRLKKKKIRIIGKTILGLQIILMLVNAIGSVINLINSYNQLNSGIEITEDFFNRLNHQGKMLVILLISALGLFILSNIIKVIKDKSVKKN